MHSKLVALLMVLMATSAWAQDKASLRLNWYLGGLHVPFYYGKERGFYSAEKIDLTINEGGGSANTVQVVAAGSDTFGLADSSSVVRPWSKGADVKSVMSLLRRPGDPLGQLLQAVCKANGVDCAKISMVQVDPAAKVVTVLEKKTDALLGGADDQYFLIKYKGATPAAMRYADFGANIVGMTIMTSGDTLRKNPDLVKRFVRATVKSWDETKKNPDAAVDAAMKAKPDLNRQSTLDQLMVDIDLLDSKNSKGRIGWGAQADWDQTLAILKNYRDLQTDKTWTAFHTNEFVP